jgi:hypothetical protein
MQVTDPAPFLAWPGGFPLPDPTSLQLRLAELVKTAAAGPCCKSKRGVLFIADDALSVAVNGPVGGAPCGNDNACREACASICNHAEMRAILRALLKPRPRALRKMHIIHIAVDASGQPRSKPVPSCITCSRDMFEVGVEAVWLYGVQQKPPGEAWAEAKQHETIDDAMEAAPSWRGWTMAAFHAETLRNCSLPSNPAVDLRARLRVVDQGWHGTLGVRYRAKLEGLTVAGGTHLDNQQLLDRAVATLLEAGVTAATPTHEVAAMIERTRRERIEAWRLASDACAKPPA